MIPVIEVSRWTQVFQGEFIMATKSRKSQKSQQESTSVKQPVAAVPSAVRSTATSPTAPPNVPPSGFSMLNDLMAKKQTVPTSRKKNDRPEMPLSPSADAMFREWIEADVLSDHFGKYCENLNSLLKPELFSLWIAWMAQIGDRPANPQLKASKKVMTGGAEQEVPDLEGKFQVQASFTIEATSADDLVKTLVSVGIPKEVADKLVVENIDVIPSIAINFSRLMYGKYVEKVWVPATPEEKIVAEKALGLLMGTPNAEPLTDPEKMLLIDSTPNISVKPNFLERLCSYIVYPDFQGTDQEQQQARLEHAVQFLTNVFSVIKPRLLTGKAKFGISDTLTERNDRLIQGAKKILGVPVATKK